MSAPSSIVHPRTPSFFGAFACGIFVQTLACAIFVGSLLAQDLTRRERAVATRTRQVGAMLRNAGGGLRHVHFTPGGPSCEKCPLHLGVLKRERDVTRRDVAWAAVFGATRRNGHIPDCPRRRGRDATRFGTGWTTFGAVCALLSPGTRSG